MPYTVIYFLNLLKLTVSFIKSDTAPITPDLISIDYEEKYDGHTLSISLFNSKRYVFSQIISGKIFIKLLKKPIVGIRFIVSSVLRYLKLDFYKHLANKLQILLFKSIKVSTYHYLHLHKCIVNCIVIS